MAVGRTVLGLGAIIFRLPCWPCAGYMLVGKLLRYLVMTSALLYWFPAAP